MKLVVVLAAIVLAMLVWPHRVGFRNEGGSEAHAITTLRLLGAMELMSQTNPGSEAPYQAKSLERVEAAARRGYRITAYPRDRGKAPTTFIATPIGTASGNRSFCMHDATIFSVAPGRPVEVADGRCVDTSTPLR